MTSAQLIYAVDDDWRFREALELTLRTCGLNVSGHACADDFLRAFNPEQAGCLITDLRMPGMDGLALQACLQKRGIRLPIIFITGHGDTAQAVAALKGGAIDFLEKPFGTEALLQSIERAFEKDRIDRRLESEKSIVRERYAHLTAREQEVFSLVVSNLPSKEIARRLKISPRTVEHHREHLMLKMQAHSLSELITMAVLCGIHELHL